MKEILEKMRAIGIVPVVVLEEEKAALPLAEALCEGGLPCAEVTFRTKAAREALRRMREAFPKMLLGAGTVLTPEQVDQAAEAGADFIVSPGFNPRVVNACIRKGLPVVPGCITPSEIEQALEYGLEAVKFFPAEAAGGLPMIRALAAPYQQIRFMPTGGISPKNVGSYLACDRVFACGGSWLTKAELVRAGDFGQIRALAEEAAALVKESRKK